MLSKYQKEIIKSVFRAAILLSFIKAWSTHATKQFNLFVPLYIVYTITQHHDGHDIDYRKDSTIDVKDLYGA